MIPSMSIILSKTEGIDRERYVYSLSRFNQTTVLNTTKGPIPWTLFHATCPPGRVQVFYFCPKKSRSILRV
uniref:Uncharacterized protein n=1 Tax=Magallana gigas TaxID=29159 RepID=A0A8W8N1M0_MAGGI